MFQRNTVAAPLFVGGLVRVKWLALLMVSLFLQVVVQAAGEKRKSAPTTEVDAVFRRANESAGERNGASLTATVDTVKTEEGKKQVRIQWTIKYTGPRFPLIILRPSLFIGTTSLEFFVLSRNGKLNRILIPPNSGALGPLYFGPESYLTVNKGETGTGMIALPWEQLAGEAMKTYPDQFRHFLPERLFLQLRHSTSQRGEHLRRDAWTGTISTELISLPIGD